jgi:hypothetical protein
MERDIQTDTGHWFLHSAPFLETSVSKVRWGAKNDCPMIFGWHNSWSFFFVLCQPKENHLIKTLQKDIFEMFRRKSKITFTSKTGKGACTPVACDHFRHSTGYNRIISK